MNLLLPLAQLLAETPVGSERWQGGGSGGVLTILFIIMIGCAAAAWWVFKRTGVPARKGEGQLDIVETKPLGGRQFLVVARHGRERFLLGVCPGKIDFLTALAREDASDQQADFESTLASAEHPQERTQGAKGTSE